MRLLYLPLLCLFSWARAHGLAATPALPILFFPNPQGSARSTWGKPRRCAFFDRGGVIYEAHGAKVRVRYACQSSCKHRSRRATIGQNQFALGGDDERLASRHTDLPSSP